MMIMTTEDFVEALVDTENNPDFGVRIGETVYGHYVDRRGLVHDGATGDVVATIDDEVLAYRTDPARDFAAE